ncbi:3-isopropylmalate dehydrogenase, partial [Acinetobacter baumannii]
EVARELARLVSSHPCDEQGKRQFVVCSGGGPSIMEAANRGAADVGAESVALNIVLPHEQAPNPYVTPRLSMQVHYFALRKMHFLLHARAL